MSGFYRKNYNSSKKNSDIDKFDKTEQLKQAIKTGLNILGYSDNTEQQVYDKLLKKGYDDDVASAAIEYLIEKRYLNEERYLKRAIVYLADNKLYGQRRIFDELRRKGFSRESLENADFSEIDFPENCAKLILKRRKNHKAYASDEYSYEEYRNELQKEYAALIRYGFSGDDIRKAYKILKAEENI